jgi:hypothetical protein
MDEKEMKIREGGGGGMRKVIGKKGNRRGRKGGRIMRLVGERGKVLDERVGVEEKR